MIQFFAEHEDRLMLGVGLSLDDLDLLQGGHPLLLPLCDGLDGELLLLNAGTPGVDGIIEVLEPDYLLRLDQCLILELSSGGSRFLETASLGLPPGELTLFSGPSNQEMIQGLLEADFFTGPLAEAEESLEEVSPCEGECLICDWLIDQESWLEESRRFNQRNQARSSDEHFIKAKVDDPKPPWWMRSTTIWAFGLLLFFGAALNAFLDSPEGPQPEKSNAPGEAFKAPEATNNLEEQGSNPLRLQALEAQIPSPAPADAPPCPWTRPAPTREEYVVGPGQADDEAALEQGWVIASFLLQAVDILPAQPGGVGPLKKRLHTEEYQLPTESAGVPIYLTLVVDSWEDPVLGSASHRAGDFHDVEVHTPGKIQGHLLAWHFDQARFVCASPRGAFSLQALQVHKAPPSLKELDDDPMLKARVEMLFGLLSTLQGSLKESGGGGGLGFSTP